jgi:endoglucanase
MRSNLVRASVLLAVAIPAQVDPHLRVDQFGYRPNAKKMALLRSAVQGFDAPLPFTPGGVIEVRRVSDQAVVWSGAPTAWQAGAVHAASGDRVWRVDFSALRTEGTYQILDVQSGRRSVPFRIAKNVYDDALRAAVRMFFYQRCGLPKQVPFAGANWTDGPSHLGPQQDGDCRAVLNPVPATSRDLRGGWFDAGDYNKYVNFADDAVHPLLDAFLDAPAYWPDDYGIPESGNGIPDLLDEVRIELDWLLRMQNQDGSLLHKVSVTQFVGASPPSADTAFRRYAPATASATASGAAVFAHAAVAFAVRPEPSMQAYAATLDQAATAAWNWLAANPSLIPSTYDNQGFVNVSAEDDAYTQAMNRLNAACWRFVRTGDPSMRTFVDQNHTAAHCFQWGWASPWESELQLALLAYSEAAGSSPSVAAAIRQTLGNSIAGSDHLANHTSDLDPYGAYLDAQNYTWGSNSTKCSHGLQYLYANRYGLDALRSRRMCEAAESYLHNLHGHNPLGLTYLTNARAIGAEGSVDEMYHGWFADGTPFDNASTSPFGPAPGYLTGGPNIYFAPASAYTGPPLVPPQNQPALKAYRDWNADWPQNSWEITEPAIGYQSRYVRLLAAFAIAPAPQLAVQVGEVSAGAVAPIQVGGADGNALVALVLGLGRGRAAFDLGFWAFDLGVELLPSPTLNLLGIGVTSASGMSAFALPPLPASAIGARLFLQASQVIHGEPMQSAVLARSVR